MTHQPWFHQRLLASLCNSRSISNHYIPSEYLQIDCIHISIWKYLIELFYLHICMILPLPYEIGHWAKFWFYGDFLQILTQTSFQEKNRSRAQIWPRGGPWGEISTCLPCCKIWWWLWPIYRLKKRKSLKLKKYYNSEAICQNRGYHGKNKIIRSKKFTQKKA